MYDMEQQRVLFFCFALTGSTTSVQGGQPGHTLCFRFSGDKPLVTTLYR
jgi:hypothetical protein